MSEVLYRKYRPQDFNEIVGQRHIVAVLKAALEKKRISHAYLLSGPRGTGKTTIARIFARAINCVQSSTLDKPCNKCENCKEFLSGATLDLIEIDAASSRGIDEIRALKEAVETLPFQAKYKVYIIDEVHMLTKEAFNALLKTLEEPPEHIVFILATTEIDKVLETIISRTQHFEFRRIPEEELQSSLAAISKKEGINTDPEALNIISLLSEGSLRDAQSMLDQVLVMNSSGIKADDVRQIFGIPSAEFLKIVTTALLEKNAKAALEVIHKGADLNLDQKAFFKLLIQNFRHLLYLKIDPGHDRELAKFLSKDEMDFLKNLAVKYQAADFEKILRELNSSYGYLKVAYLPQLPLELAILKITI